MARSATRYNSKRSKCGGNNFSISVPKGTTLSILAADDAANDSFQRRFVGGNKRHEKRNQKKGRRGVLVDRIDANSEKNSFADGLISMSKSENNLFEKFSTDGGGGGQKLKLLPGFDGVVTSMRDLQFEMSPSNDREVMVTTTMNDFSRTQVLNTLAVSKEIMCRSEDKREGYVYDDSRESTILNGYCV